MCLSSLDRRERKRRTTRSSSPYKERRCCLTDVFVEIKARWSGLSFGNKVIRIAEPEWDGSEYLEWNGIGSGLVGLQGDGKWFICA